MKPTGPRVVRRMALTLVIAIMVACSWLAPIDSAANAQVDAGLKRALFSFATARALNAIISVAQGTEVAVQPAGVGIVFTPGQVLDPVNDLVEQFSNLMLAASISFGIQKVLISIGVHWAISLLLSMTALGWAIFYLSQQSAPAWLSRILVVLLMTRFAIPVVTIGTDVLFQHFMSADYQSSQQVMDTASGHLGKLNRPAADTNVNPGVLDKLKGWWKPDGDEKSRFEQLRHAAEQATEHIIKLMVIFLLQTMIIPLLLLWILYSVAKRTFEWPAKPAV